MKGPATAPVVIVGPDDASHRRAVESMEEAGFSVVHLHSAGAVFETIANEPPACIIVALDAPGTQGATLLQELKGDSLYGHVPVIGVVEPQRLPEIDWHATHVDDYLVAGFQEGDLVARVRLCIARALRDVNANPLTGLPGNFTIVREAERRIAAGTRFAVAYLDVDNFKPYNDKYGFSRGDEVLRMTARIILNAVANAGTHDTYVGHVGGDDFVFMTPPDVVENVCTEILRDFDLIVPNFYDEEDRAAGLIHSVDRAGNPRVFPLMSCTIAVVDTGVSQVRHIGDISARAAQVKHYAKNLSGSAFLVDRRK